MSQVRFIVRERNDLNGVAEVVPEVDGVALTDLIHGFEKRAGMETRNVSYGGLIPAYFRFGPLRHHFLAGAGAFVSGQRKVPLLGCKCGEWGCWPLLTSVRADDASVAWSAFEQPHRPERDYSGFGPFQFERAEHEEELQAQERSVSDPEGDA